MVVEQMVVEFLVLLEVSLQKVLLKKNINMFMSKIKLILKTTKLETLLLYSSYLQKSFSLLKIKFSFVNLPKKKKLITLNKSPHVNKTAREQFILFNYSAVFFLNISNKMISLKYLLFNIPKTIFFKIEKI